MAHYAKNKTSAAAARYYRYSAAAIICVFAVNSGLFATPADANRAFLQPQALDFVGVYALRTIDPNLTGEGVTFGIVSRSYTYEVQSL